MNIDFFFSERLGSGGASKDWGPQAPFGAVLVSSSSGTCLLQALLWVVPQVELPEGCLECILPSLKAVTEDYCSSFSLG